MNHSKKAGGEGGIRTLDTGVSPYNGLANQSFLPPSLVFSNLRSCKKRAGRTSDPSFGNYCAPVCAPHGDAVFKSAIQ